MSTEITDLQTLRDWLRNSIPTYTQVTEQADFAPQRIDDSFYIQHTLLTLQELIKASCLLWLLLQYTYNQVWNFNKSLISRKNLVY